MNNTNIIIVSTCVLILSLAGCRYPVEATSVSYISMPAYALTDPSKIQILQQFPQQPHQNIGEILIEPDSETRTTAEIEQKLREQASNLGADAVVIVEDRIAQAGLRYYGYYREEPVYGHQVKGIAIKMK